MNEAQQKEFDEIYRLSLKVSIMERDLKEVEKEKDDLMRAFMAKHNFNPFQRAIQEEKGYETWKRSPATMEVRMAALSGLEAFREKYGSYPFLEEQISQVRVNIDRATKDQSHGKP